MLLASPVEERVARFRRTVGPSALCGCRLWTPSVAFCRRPDILELRAHQMSGLRHELVETRVASYRHRRAHTDRLRASGSSLWERCVQAVQVWHGHVARWLQALIWVGGALGGGSLSRA